MEESGTRSDGAAGEEVGETSSRWKADLQFDRRTLLLARFTLFGAAAYLFIAQKGRLFIATDPAWILGAALLSNLVLIWVPKHWFRSTFFVGGLLVVDVVWITAAMVANGELNPELLFIYFLVIFLAGIGESLSLIALATLAVGLGYLYLAWALGGWSYVRDPAILSRLPFLVAVAAFYGYVVEQAREQRSRAQEEHNLAEESLRAQDRLAEQTRLIEATNEELQRSSEMKSGFVSMVSHELRTPLAAMKTALEILESQTADIYDDVQRRFLEIAVRNVDRLTAMVNDLLDVSRMEAGRMNLHFDEVDLEERLQAVRTTFEGQASANQIALGFEVPGDLPRIWADGGRVEQVVGNLVSNALKFTPEDGRVDVRVQPQADRVQVEVVDSGIGIPADEVDRVFEPFHQVDQTLTREVTGSGLGLAISQELVEIQGGTLSVESWLGKGSRFWFHLPTASDRAREMVRTEQSLTEYRKYPFFCLMLLDLEPMAPGLEEGRRHELTARAQEWAQGFLTRGADRLHAQPDHFRLALFSLGTDTKGTNIFAGRLRRLFVERPMEWEGSTLPPPQILGPVEYPAQGRTSWQLVDSILGVSAEPGKEVVSEAEVGPDR